MLTFNRWMWISEFCISIKRFLFKNIAPPGEFQEPITSFDTMLKGGFPPIRPGQPLFIQMEKSDCEVTTFQCYWFFGGSYNQHQSCIMISSFWAIHANAGFQSGRDLETTRSLRLLLWGIIPAFKNRADVFHTRNVKFFVFDEIRNHKPESKANVNTGGSSKATLSRKHHIQKAI